MKCPKCKTDASTDSLFCHKCGISLSGKPADYSPEATRDFGKETSFFFSPGDNFGKRYKIIEEIDRGGMGRVYKAKDKVLNTVVALKMIRPEFLTDSRMINRFKKGGSENREDLISPVSKHIKVWRRANRIMKWGLKAAGFKFYNKQFKGMLASAAELRVSENL